MDKIKSPYPVLRSGKTIDMNEIISELESEIRCNLKASIEAYESYDEVSTETYNDYIRVKGIIEVYCKCGYISTDEAKALTEGAWIMRKDKLHELEIIESVDEGKRNS